MITIFDGSKIKVLRGKKTRDRLARDLESVGLQISGQMIAQWENGKAIPSAEKLAQVAIFFGKPILSFFKKSPDFLEAKIKAGVK